MDDNFQPYFMTTISRINQIATNEGITLTKLERNIDASKGVLSRALKNSTDIQSKWISKLVENYPSYNTHWLLTGEGDMLLGENKRLQGAEGCAECEKLKEKIGLLEKLVESKDETIKAYQESSHSKKGSSKLGSA